MKSFAVQNVRKDDSVLINTIRCSGEQDYLVEMKASFFFEIQREVRWLLQKSRERDKKGWPRDLGKVMIKIIKE